MGRPKQENSIRHFSHPHPLFPSSLNPQDHSSSCVVCKLQLLSLPSYTCKPCNFHIHLKCSELPQKIKHSFDKNHLLSLISSPKYQEGRFLCDACGKGGDGFAYHCGECGIDLHTICANMPSQVTHQAHPHHQLSLTFSTPAGGSGSRSRSAIPGSFHCSVCHSPGSNSWLYSCKECGGFNAHLLCCTRKLDTSPNLVQQGLNQQRPQFNGTTPFNNVSNPNYVGHNPAINNLYPYGPNPGINNPYPFGQTNQMDMINNFVNNMPQDPSQVSQFMDLLGPLGVGGGGPFGTSGPSSFSGFPGFDPSSFGSINPPVFHGFDPSGFGSIYPPVFPGFDPSGLGSINPSSFPGFDPTVLGSVDPSVLAGFDPSVFAESDPSAFGSVDPSVYAESDPSLLSTLFSGLGLL